MGNVINFETKERLLSKARDYTASIERALEEEDEAIPLLCRAFRYAPPELKQKIILLIGSFAREDVVWTLYGIMKDTGENEEIRRSASIQLSVAASFLSHPQPIIDTLINDMDSVDSLVKQLAAFALGWEGNVQAAIPLIELLYDTDTELQQTAVNALANLRDDRILNLLLERLDHGALDQKRTILYNLRRFYSRRDEVVAVYLKYLDHADEDLRLDALILLKPVVATEAYLSTYGRCMHDSSARVRRLALESVMAVDAGKLAALRSDIHGLLADPDPVVKRLATNCLNKINQGNRHDGDH
jgi:HEAT repeat protein